MEEDQKSFTVKDRRRFDSSGNEKSETESVAQSASNVNTATPNFTTTSSEDPVLGEDGSQVSFQTFVMSMAMQALMQLGEMGAPDGSPIRKDKQAARQSIELLSMIKDKTKGNLSPEESNMLEEILHNLRLAFIRN